MSDITDRKTDMNEAYTQSWAAWGNWQSHARDDLYAVVDNAWTKEDIAYMKKVMPDREIMSFPMLRKHIRLISNFERTNRTSIKYEPVEGSDELTAAQYTLIANDMLARNRGYQVRSDCFDGALKTGLTLLNLSPIFELVDGGYGVTGSHFERFAYNQFVLHPSFTKRDLSDCQYGILRKPITSSEAKRLFPDLGDYIDHLLKRDRSDDEKFPNMPKLKLYGKYLLNLDEWTRRTTVNKRYFVQQGQFVRDPFGNRVEFNEDAPEHQFALFENPTLDVMESVERTVEVTQYLNGEEVYHGIDPFGIGDFSFTPYFAYFDPEVDHFHLRIQSAVRALKDSQRSFDRRTIAGIRALEYVVNAGTDFEEGALVDPKQAYTAGHGPRFFKDGAIAGGQFKERPAPNIPPGWFQLQEQFEKLPGKILNLNEDGLFGTDQKDQLLLGVVGKLRLGLGQVGMFDFFDNKSFSDQVMGMKMMRLIQQYPASTATRILNEQLSQAFYAKDFGKYDAISAEAVLTDSQKNAQFQQLLQMKIQSMSGMEPFPLSWSDILALAPTALPHKLKATLQQKAQQQAQAQQRAEQLREAVQVAALKQADIDVVNEQVHAQERAADLMETKVDIAQKLQEMTVQPQMDMLDREIEMQKIEAMKGRNNESKGN